MNIPLDRIKRNLKRCDTCHRCVFQFQNHCYDCESTTSITRTVNEFRKFKSEPVLQIEKVNHSIPRMIHGRSPLSIS